MRTRRLTASTCGQRRQASPREDRGEATRPYREAFATEAAAAEYADQLASGEFIDVLWSLERAALATALARAELRRDIRCLDIGVRHGWIGFLAPFVTSCVGVDVSESMLSYARARYPSVLFLCSDISSDDSSLSNCGPFRHCVPVPGTC